MDVGEGQKQTGGSHSPVRRRGEVEWGRDRVVLAWKMTLPVTKPDLPTRHRTPDPQRWRFRLALDVGEGQKQTGCSHSPVRRRGEVEWGRIGSFWHGK